MNSMPETIAEALQVWDSGGTLFTVEMGGIGPGYEMAIQALMFEILRELKDEMIPKLGIDWPKSDREKLQPRVDAVVHRLNSGPRGGLSGAQVGAATNLAVCLLRRHSYAAALREPEVQDRLIQVSRKDLSVA